MDGTPSSGWTAECGNQVNVGFDKNCVRSSPTTKKLSTIAESPGLCETPVRERRLSKICENEIYSPKTRPRTPGMPLSNLPILTTPPSRLNFVVQNPFDETLRKNLHMPFISPTLFTNVMSPSQGESFSWSIEDLANMLPAEIDEFQMQNDQLCDEQTEQEVQRSISRFFESNNIVPSPWGTYETFKPLTVSDLNHTPIKSTTSEEDPVTTVLDFEDNENPLFPPVKREAWTQTEVTVPIEVHSPFDSLSEQLQFEKDEPNEENMENNSATVKNMCSSPCYSLYKSLLSSTIHTPKNKIIRSFETPLGRNSLMSPIGLSPIVRSFQQVGASFEISRESVESIHCSCHIGISCDSGISSAMSQTDVTFPRILPKNIEEVLKPFQTFIYDQSEVDDVNLNSSLSHRRKLFFNENLDMSVSSVHSFDNGYDSC